MKKWKLIPDLLQADFKFLIDEAGFSLLEAPSKHEAQLGRDDIRIALRNHWKDEAFIVACWSDKEPSLMYSLAMYIEFFDQHKYPQVRDVPGPAVQAARLKELWPRIEAMLQSPGVGAQWEAFRAFFFLRPEDRRQS